MRVLLLDQFSDLGGAQQCLLELLPAMLDRGWSAMAGLPGNGELVTHLHNFDVPTASLCCGPYHAGRKSASDTGRFLIEGPRLIRQIRTMAADFRPDVLYVNGPRLLPATAIASMTVPVVFHSHSYLPSAGARRLAGASLRRLGARVLANCGFTAAPWRQYVENVTVIYNGVAGPPPLRTHAKESTGLAIGCIGRIAPEKGHFAFMKAAAQIHDAVPNCRFLIFGAPLFSSPEIIRYHSELHRMAEGLPVEFRGWTNDVYTALAELDLVLVPSAKHEATTRVILEAFSAGVPVIALRSGGIPEVVEHDRNGLLAESEGELAPYAISLLSATAARRAAMAERARTTWRERFTLIRYQQQVLDSLAGFARNRREADAETTAPLLSPRQPRL